MKNSGYTPKFWNGHRESDVIKVQQAAKEGSDWQKFVYQYYRMFNDGDVPNFNTMKRLARVTGVEFDKDRRAEFMDQVGEALLDRELAVA